MGDILRRRAMMAKAAAPSVEPNYTITDFTGNGTTSVTVDLGISNPSIIIVYPKTPLSSGSFPNSNNNQRLFQLHDTGFDLDYYANTRNSTSTGYYLWSSDSTRLEYANGALSIANSTIPFRNGYAYRAVAIKQAASDVTMTNITGNGQSSINVDLGISNPSILIVYAATPITSGSFPSVSSQRLLCLADHDISTTRQYYVNTATSTSRGDNIRATTSAQLTYQNGILTVSGSAVLRNDYGYKVIAIK